MTTYNEKAWAFVRKAKNTYTAWDLARIAQVPISFAKRYLAFLREAKYIKVSGKKGKSYVYITLKITGIKPVKINPKRKTVEDENTGEKIQIPALQHRSIKYQQIWDVIRKLKEFTVQDIYSETKIDKMYIRFYLNHLRRANIISIKAKEGSKNIYQLEKDIGKKYPSIKTKKEKEEITQPNEKFQKIWNKIREKKEFKIKDLKEELPEITFDYIRVYVRHLQRSGYLDFTEKNKRKGYKYILVRNSGNIAPVLKLHKQPIVYDLNKNKAYLSIGD